jgi:PAS domain S-box-containing protein
MKGDTKSHRAPVAHAGSHGTDERPAGLESFVLASLGHPIVAVDLDEVIIYWNKAAESLYGWRADEALGRHARELLAPAISQEQAQEIMEVLQAGKVWTSQVALRRRDGSEFSAFMVNAALRDGAGRLIGFTTLIRDVTLAADLEEANRQMSTSLASAQRIANLGSWEWDLLTGQVAWSDELFELLGIPRDSEPDLRTFWARVHPDDVARVQEEVRLDVAAKRDSAFDYRILLPDGTIKMVHARSHVTSTVAGRPARLVGTVLDITQRWEAEEALRASEERFRTLVDTTADVVWCTDAAGRPTHGVSNWSDFTGMTPEEMVDEASWVSVVHPEDRAATEAKWREALERGTDYNHEYRLRRRDGAWRNVIARGAAIRDRHGAVREWVGTCVDVTDLKAADEAAQFRSQVLDTTGESIIVTDPAGKIIYINRFAETQFGWSASEALGSDIMEVTVPTVSRELAEEIMAP